MRDLNLVYATFVELSVNPLKSTDLIESADFIEIFRFPVNSSIQIHWKTHKTVRSKWGAQGKYLYFNGNLRISSEIHKRPVA